MAASSSFYANGTQIRPQISRTVYTWIIFQTIASNLAPFFRGGGGCWIFMRVFNRFPTSIQTHFDYFNNISIAKTAHFHHPTAFMHPPLENKAELFKPFHFGNGAAIFHSEIWRHFPTANIQMFQHNRELLQIFLIFDFDFFWFLVLLLFGFGNGTPAVDWSQKCGRMEHGILWKMPEESHGMVNECVNAVKESSSSINI